MNAAGCGCSSATLPAATRGRVEHGLADFLRFVGILEGRPAIFSGFKGFEEICHLMHERMFVSNAQSRYPPFVHVRLLAIRHMYGSPSPQVGFIAVIKILQSVEVMQIPAQGAVGTVDLKGV
jgi:hypothetical protein